MRSVISPLFKRVVTSHPRSNAWIANDPHKCDRIDATKLADLLRMNRFTEVYYAQEKSRRDFLGGVLDDRLLLCRFEPMIA